MGRTVSESRMLEISTSGLISEDRKRGGFFRATASVLNSTNMRAAYTPGLNGRNLASFSFWPLVQPFSELLQHAMEGRSDRAASRLHCAKSPLRRAFEMADLAAFLWGGHGVGSSYLYILY